MSFAAEKLALFFSLLHEEAEQPLQQRWQAARVSSLLSPSLHGGNH